jgi:hypothetical protein
MSDANNSSFDFEAMINKIAREAGLNDGEFKMPKSFPMPEMGDIMNNPIVEQFKKMADLKVEVIGSRIIIDCPDDATAAEIAESFNISKKLYNAIPTLMDLFKGFM